MAEYRPRLADKILTELAAQLPALAVTGPRATGKTTTAGRLAATVIRLDRGAEAAAFRADPDVALRGLQEPVLLDEWQEVPGVLGAVKRSIDQDSRAGRYILTGSVRLDLDAQTWPGTGRVVRLPMHGLSQREIAGDVSGALFLDRLLDADMRSLGAAGTHDLADYLELAVRGGFPEPALRLTGLAGQAWLDSYVEQLITRDAPALDRVRDPERLRRYVEALAVNGAGVVENKTLYDAVGIDRRTAVAYEQLLKNLLVLEAVPGWASNRLARLTGMPKRYLVDSSLMAAALRLDSTAILRDGNLLDRMIDTFVAAQIRPELSIASSRPRWYHLRDKGGRHEIDLLIEFGGGRVAGIEITASAAPGQADARHLVWLRDELGDRFAAGVVLHTGPRTYELGEMVVAAPISTIWA
ncbi:MAG: putative binding protein [Frankiales bacterium]|nr:putative binding protein [Frankiales bacterium]